MKPIETTPFDVAQRFIGIRELPGDLNHPLIQFWLSLCFDGKLDLPDSVAWCSAFMQFPFWLLGQPRSKSARARSWLKVGRGVDFDAAEPGFDVAILCRGEGKQPGPEVLDAPGHVALFAGWEAATSRVLVVGGNQNDEVNVSAFDADRVIGIRRCSRILW